MEDCESAIKKYMTNGCSKTEVSLFAQYQAANGHGN